MEGARNIQIVLMDDAGAEEREVANHRTRRSGVDRVHLGMRSWDTEVITDILHRAMLIIGGQYAMKSL